MDPHLGRPRDAERLGGRRLARPGPGLPPAPHRRRAGVLGASALPETAAPARCRHDAEPALRLGRPGAARHDRRPLVAGSAGLPESGPRRLQYGGSQGLCVPAQSAAHAAGRAAGAVAARQLGRDAPLEPARAADADGAVQLAGSGEGTGALLDRRLGRLSLRSRAAAPRPGGAARAERGRARRRRACELCRRPEARLGRRQGPGAGQRVLRHVDLQQRDGAGAAGPRPAVQSAHPLRAQRPARLHALRTARRAAGGRAAQRADAVGREEPAVHGGEIRGGGRTAGRRRPDVVRTTPSPGSRAPGRGIPPACGSGRGSRLRAPGADRFPGRRR